MCNIAHCKLGIEAQQKLLNVSCSSTIEKIAQDCCNQNCMAIVTDKIEVLHQNCKLEKTNSNGQTVCMFLPLSVGIYQITCYC